MSRGVLDGRSGRNSACRRKEEWHTEQSDWTVRIPLRQEIEGDGGNRADEEKVEVAVVNLAALKNSLGADCSPDYRCREKCFCSRASKTLSGISRADSVNVAE